MTTPRAPASSTRVAIVCCMNGTRTIGEIPVSSEATAIVVANSIDIGPCSRSMNSQSKPLVFIILAISTVRAVLIPTPSDISPFSSRSRATLRTCISLAPINFTCFGRR